MSVPPLLCAIHSARAGYEPTKGEQVSHRCLSKTSVWPMRVCERRGAIASALTRRTNERQSAPCGPRRYSQTRPVTSNTASRVRTDRTLEVSFPTTDYCSNQMTAFCRCTAYIVVIDAEQIDQSWSTDTLPRRSRMSTLDEITKEKQRVGEALARVDAQREKLTGQLGELEAAERVLAR